MSYFDIMNRLKSLPAILLILASPSGYAQTSEAVIVEPAPKPVIGRLLEPFHIAPRSVPPPKLTNTPRLESLVRAGNLYLSVEDVIALVLENNLDIAIQRYGPLLTHEVLRRAQGGGQLRSVDTAISPGPVSVSLAGVSVNTGGLASGAESDRAVELSSNMDRARPTSIRIFSPTHILPTSRRRRATRS